MLPILQLSWVTVSPPACGRGKSEGWGHVLSFLERDQDLHTSLPLTFHFHSPSWPLTHGASLFVRECGPYAQPKFHDHRRSLLSLFCQEFMILSPQPSNLRTLRGPCGSPNLRTLRGSRGPPNLRALRGPHGANLRSLQELRGSCLVNLRQDPAIDAAAIYWLRHAGTLAPGVTVDQRSKTSRTTQQNPQEYGEPHDSAHSHTRKSLFSSANLRKHVTLCFRAPGGSVM